MRTTLLPLLLGATLISGASCATKRETGAATGAVAGGIVGGVLGGDTGLLIGAAVGGLLGYGAGAAIEREDRRRIAYALERNEPVEWQNPETGYEYEVQPTQYEVREGRRCREFRLLAEDSRGRQKEVYGTACRQPDGSWELVDQRG
jgi:surface antigen